jgi:sortase A
VVEGTTHRDLLLGPGHIKSTAQPGAVGNAVITAHRDTFFRHIYELQKGDTVTVQRNGKLFQYAVTGKKIVSPTDVSVILPSSDNRLTLITCYPTYYIGPAPERLVVFSELVQQSNGSPSVQETKMSDEKTASQ